MAITYHAILSGTRIIGVLTVDDGESVDPSFTTTPVPGWPARPALPNQWSQHHLISGTITIVDPRTLAQAKADQIAVLKAAREVVINNTFVWDGSTFDADLTARNRLAALKLDSLQPDFVPRPWRLADNTWRTLSAADVANVWIALGIHTFAQYDSFADVESDVLAAASIAAVVAVEWPA